VQSPTTRNSLPPNINNTELEKSYSTPAFENSIYLYLKKIYQRKYKWSAPLPLPEHIIGFEL
jgi:hypothetical protein